MHLRRSLQTLHLCREPLAEDFRDSHRHRSEYATETFAHGFVFKRIALLGILEDLSDGGNGRKELARCRIVFQGAPLIAPQFHRVTETAKPVCEHVTAIVCTPEGDEGIDELFRMTLQQIGDGVETA